MTQSQVDRTLAVDGLRNVRDLGGLRRLDASLTPRGVFYRSENVDLLSEAGWDQLRAAGIRTVVDLRQPVERAKDRSARPRWLTVRNVDLDGVENEQFWSRYRPGGLDGTALFYLPHLTELPERAVAALSAIVTAPPGGVLFHCMGGRDRSGLIALLLLAAIDTEPEQIVADYLETVRLGKRQPIRASRDQAGHRDTEPELEAICRANGTTTEQAFRRVLDSLELARVLAAGGMSAADQCALRSWRASLPV